MYIREYDSSCQSKVTRANDVPSGVGRTFLLSLTRLKAVDDGCRFMSLGRGSTLLWTLKWEENSDRYNIFLLSACFIYRIRPLLIWMTRSINPLYWAAAHATQLLTSYRRCLSLLDAILSLSSYNKHCFVWC